MSVGGEGRGNWDRLSCDRSRLQFIGGLGRVVQEKARLKKKTDVGQIRQLIFNHRVSTSLFNERTE